MEVYQNLIITIIGYVFGAGGLLFGFWKEESLTRK